MGYGVLSIKFFYTIEWLTSAAESVTKLYKVEILQNSLLSKYHREESNNYRLPQGPPFQSCSLFTIVQDDEDLQ